jgi:succinate-semialdehyde dehydrogenase / glutarate-semialdehyde dehydrogenase
MAYQTTNPATRATMAAFEEISDLELAKLIDVAQACYERDWRNRPIAQRAQIVRRRETDA